MSATSSSSRYAQVPRSTVYGTRGMVSCSQPAATQAGFQILKNGGNAIDAAIATAAALAVTQPCSTGLGGDVFALVYLARSGRVVAINGSGCSASDATRHDAVLAMRKEGDDVPSAAGEEGKEEEDEDRVSQQWNVHSNRHALAVNVPGACAAWCDLIEWYGSKTISEVLQPAIALAEKGSCIHHVASYLWKAWEERLLQTPNGTSMLVPDKQCERGFRSPREGELWVNESLGQVLRSIATHGKPGFYEGKVAQEIVDVVQKNGGKLSLDDLRQHQTLVEEPIHVSYRDEFEVYEAPPNGQGIIALQALKIFEHIKAASTDDSALRFHYMIEALRLAFADAKAYVADPRNAKVPTLGMLDETYCASRAKLIQKHRMLQVAQGAPEYSSDTVLLTVTDAEGNAVSFLNSNYAGFGTGIVPLHCGFTLQNRGANFVLQKSHPNCFAPRKRSYHTIIPCMIFKNRQLFATMGCMGGFMQPQGHLQMISNFIDLQMDAQKSVHVPRFCILDEKTVAIESCKDTQDLIAQLKAWGHTIEERSYGDPLFGRAHAITVSIQTHQGTHSIIKRRIYAGGCDPRSDGICMGL